MRMCQREKVTIGDVSRLQQSPGVRLRRVQQRNIVRPESMSWQLSKRSQQPGHNRGRAGRIRISRMADNAQYAIFRQRAGRPGLMPFRREPGMRAVVLHMDRINQSN